MEIKNPEKVHRKTTMPAVIDARNRQLEEEEPIWVEFWNNVSNLTCEYYVAHNVFPRYLYVNSRVWESANNELTRQWAEGLALQALPHPKMPWDKVAMHHERHHPADVADYYRRHTSEELIDSGRAVIV